VAKLGIIEIPRINYNSRWNVLLLLFLKYNFDICDFFLSARYILLHLDIQVLTVWLVLTARGPALFPGTGNNNYFVAFTYYIKNDVTL
jgi:hypothetical protein